MPTPLATSPITRVAAFCFVVVGLLVVFPAGGDAEQASQPGFAPAGMIDTGRLHSCAIGAVGEVRCWGDGGAGQLGYPGVVALGDDEAPGSVAPVDLGDGRTARAISAGGFHTCALLDDATVRCWGFGAEGRLGYSNEDTIGDNETPGSAGPVFLGEGRTAKAISAGYGHTCAVLDDNTVRCWGYNDNGALGYPNGEPIGDNETPGSRGPVNLGEGRTAKAISAGQDHTCALLDDNTVRCWGNTVVAGPVALGAGRTAKAISAGDTHACALLDNNTVRCWGEGSEGALGYGNTATIGDNETPASAGPVNLGAGRTARAISAGRHTCAILDNNSVRCWGRNRDGQLGYAHTRNVGDNETPGSVAPVNLGAGRTATATALSDRHTCARLDDGDVRCWGFGANGRLGNCDQRTIGDDETPAAAGPVPLAGDVCPPYRGVAPSNPPADSPRAAFDPDAAALKAQADRLRALRTCFTKVGRHARLETRRARRLSGSRRARAKRHIRRHRSQLRARCLKRHGRTPGRVTGLGARALGATSVLLSFRAPGTDASRPPAARGYLIKQSRRPIRSARAFRRAHTLCKGSCRFSSIRVGGALSIMIGDLRPRTTYYYAVAARDNVSCRPGRRSRAAKVRTLARGAQPPQHHSGPEAPAPVSAPAAPQAAQPVCTR